MIIQEIIAIAGKPGLYRIIKTNRANLVVESMLDKKTSQYSWDKSNQQSC